MNSDSHEYSNTSNSLLKTDTHVCHGRSGRARDRLLKTNNVDTSDGVQRHSHGWHSRGTHFCNRRLSERGPNQVALTVEPGHHERFLRRFAL